MILEATTEIQVKCPKRGQMVGWATIVVGIVVDEMERNGWF